MSDVKHIPVQKEKKNMYLLISTKCLYAKTYIVQLKTDFVKMILFIYDTNGMKKYEAESSQGNKMC